MSKVLIDRELLCTALKADASIGATAHELVAGWGAMEKLRGALLDTPSGTPAMPVKAYYHESPNEYGGFNKSVGLEVRKEFTDAPLVLEADAQAIIDGLRGKVGAQRVKTCIALKERNDAREERDSFQRVGIRAMEERDHLAQRVGELEGLLRSCLPALSDGGCAALANRIDAAMSAGKEASK